MPDLDVDSSALLNDGEPSAVPGVELRLPTIDDGAAMWRMARDSRVLDVNTSYAYLLWARDFSATSVVAVDEAGEPCGFVSGYVRPDRPDTLMVWQVAVDASQRGRGIARQMLDELFDRDDAVTALETTITDDNAASIALFSAFGKGRGLTCERTHLFPAAAFPDGHDAELLFRFASAQPSEP